MCSSKTSLHFPNLKVNPKPFLFQNSFGLCCHCVSHSFLGKLCNIFLLDQKGQHQRAVWLQSALSSAPLLTITIESKNVVLQMCQMCLLNVSTPNLFHCSFCNILRFSANPPNITCFWILINTKECFFFFYISFFQNAIFKCHHLLICGNSATLQSIMKIYAHTGWCF